MFNLVCIGEPAIPNPILGILHCLQNFSVGRLNPCLLSPLDTRPNRKDTKSAQEQYGGAN